MEQHALVDLAMSTSFFRLRGIKKSFGDLRVLEGVDIDIHQREVITFVGRSGGGKSVLLKMLIGLIRPDAGTIEFDGQDVTNLSEKEWVEVRQRVGISFQEPALFDSMTVADNVKYGLVELGEMSASEMDERASQSLERVGLPGIEHMWPASLSGGMKKRVGIARAVALRPEVLIYDEPTEGLDPINVTRVNRLMLGLRERLDVTTLVATQHMGSAFSTSDRIAFLHDGRIEHVDTPDALVKKRPPEMADFLDKATFQVPSYA